MIAVRIIQYDIMYLYGSMPFTSFSQLYNIVHASLLNFHSFEYALKGEMDNLDGRFFFLLLSSLQLLNVITAGGLDWFCFFFLLAFDFSFTKCEKERIS